MLKAFLTGYIFCAGAIFATFQDDRVAFFAALFMANMWFCVAALKQEED